MSEPENDFEPEAANLTHAGGEISNDENDVDLETMSGNKLINYLIHKLILFILKERTTWSMQSSRWPNV